MNKVKNLEVYEGMLIIVDMVNGFTTEGVLADPNIKKIIPRQIELIKEAHKKGELIVFIKDTHDKDSIEFKRFKNTKHCVRKTKEADITDELKPYKDLENTIEIEKNSTSFMESPTFREMINQAKNIKTADIVGCCTDICVVNGSMGLANYYDEHNRDVTINVHEDAIATYNEEERSEYVAAAKLLMKQQGIQLVKKK